MSERTWLDELFACPEDMDAQWHRLSLEYEGIPGGATPVYSIVVDRWGNGLAIARCSDWSAGGWRFILGVAK